MKASIILIFLFLSLNKMNAQESEENRFQQTENATTGTNGSAIGGVGDLQEQGPGNPPGEDEIPIDNYLPGLAIIGASILVYRYKHKFIKTI